MASVDRKPKSNGKYRFCYTDESGTRTSRIGTRSRTETRRIAEHVEDRCRRIRLGYLASPSSAQENGMRPFAQVRDEYLAWGNSQGGRGGRPWGRGHLRMRRAHLNWWGECLDLETLSELEGCLPRVEAALRDLQDAGRAGKTVRNYVEGLKAFCRWCVHREYLSCDPLAHLAPLDTTPKTTRRAMTEAEIRRLLEKCASDRRLTYAVALFSGLRASELRALKVGDLCAERGGLELRAEWTKNRKASLHPIAEWLCEVLAAHADGKPSTAPLLEVPTHTARELDKDLAAAGIPKETTQGKLDFHSLRVTYVTLLLEAGANVKDLQALARHSTADFTLNVYGRARVEHLREVAGMLGENVLSPTACVQSAYALSAPGEAGGAKALGTSGLRQVEAPDGAGFDSRRLHHTL